jgi:hypothetical protein
MADEPHAVEGISDEIHPHLNVLVVLSETNRAASVGVEDAVNLDLGSLVFVLPFPEPKSV